jgi:hypothetical protein
VSIHDNRPVEERLRVVLRRRAAAAYNAAHTWNDHPTYNKRAWLLHDIDGAVFALHVLMEVEYFRGDVMCGVSLPGMAKLRAAVAGRKRGERMDLPRFDDVVVVGVADTDIGESGLVS